MADKFPSDFYVTCATVIPVLFLALAVQGRAFESVLKAGDRAIKHARTIREPPPPSQRTHAIRVGIAAPILSIIANFVLLAGGYGEGLALYSLYKGSETNGGRTLVFLSALFLLGAVLAIPLVAALGLPAPLKWLSAVREDEAAGDEREEPPQDTGSNGHQAGAS